MKKNFKLTLVGLLLLCGLSCIREKESSGETISCVKVETSVQGLSKSLFNGEDDAVTDINVYAYRDGMLAGSAYGDGSSLSLNLVQGYTYRLYVLANVGEQEAPALESALEDYRIALPAADSREAAAGLPMASRHGTAFRAARSSATLSIELERLVGKVCLFIEKNLSRTDFQVAGVKILQAAGDVTPFSGGSRAVSTVEGDAASAADIAALNRGEEVCFYVPENSAGILLPDNLDQWKKVPSRIGQYAALCTYMQVWGSWSTPGASADVTYRMYLGRDNCSDFNVDGNTESLLTLSLTDEGVFTASWKVEMRNLQDGRRLRFASRTLSLSQGGGSADLGIIAEPKGLDFRLYVDQEPLEAAGLSYSLEDLLLRLRTDYIGTQEKCARFYLRSWDGLLADTLTVTVPYVAGEYTDFSYTMPRYVAQWGSFHFPHASVSAPVRFVSGSRNQVIYPGAARWSFLDNATGLRFVYDGNTRVWVSAVNLPAEGAAPMSLTVACGSLSRQLSLHPASVPRYGFSEALVLTESGNLAYDAAGWYDKELDLHLLDDEGFPLELSRFATPDAVLALWGITPDDESRYAALSEAYGSSMWGEFSEGGYAGYSMTFFEDAMEDLLPENSLARFRLWGLAAEGDEPALLCFNIVNDGLSRYYEEALPLTVLPAFPAQRYLGEYENRQIASGDLRASSVALDFTAGGHTAPISRGVNWTLSGADFSPSEKPCASMMQSRPRRCANVSFDGSALHFSYNRIAGDALCAGAYGLTGEVVNPHSGRTIRGWYTFDVVLYMSVGACVANLGETVLGYSFVPFCEYTTPYDSDLWNDCVPAIPIRAVLESGQKALTSLRVPLSAGEHAFPLSLNGDYRIFHHSFDYNCYYLYNFTNWQCMGDFYFYLDGRETTNLNLNREGYALTTAYSHPDYVRGVNGYYRLVRQRDLANLPRGNTFGLSNYLVEAAFGSFDSL